MLRIIELKGFCFAGGGQEGRKSMKMVRSKNQKKGPRDGPWKAKLGKEPRDGTRRA